MNGRAGGFPQLQGAPAGTPQLPAPAYLQGQGYAGAILASVIEQKIGNRPWNWFEYQAEWLTLAASAPGQPANIQIESDSDFMALACVGIARANAAGGAVLADRAFLIQITQGGSGNYLFSSPTDFDMVVGTAQNPAWWGLPRLMPRSSTFTITLNNLIATAYNVRVGFWGIKIFGENTSR